VESICKATQEKVILKIRGEATECSGITEQEEDGAGAHSYFAFGMESTFLRMADFQDFCCWYIKLSQEVLESLSALPATAVKGFISLGSVAEFGCK